VPRITVNGADIYYEERGKGPETIVFSHGLLWSGYMFQNQISALEDKYRCIAFDFRGQGQSEITPTGYDMETLYSDAVSLIEKLGCTPCHFVGLSMGGFIGLRLGIRRPDLLKSLTIIESSPDPEAPETIKQYRMLNIIARWLGLKIVADKVMEIMFGKKFLNDPERTALKQEWKERMIANHRIGITRAVTGVITRQGVSEQLEQIKTPTLIIVGDQDVATVPAKAEKMHASISNSKLVIIPGAGHTSTVEEPIAVTDAMTTFLKGLAA